MAAPKGNRNAAKDRVKKQWATRLDQEAILKMQKNAARRSLSLAAYIEWLINNDKP